MDQNIIKKQITGDDIDLNQIFIPLYARGWRQPQSISLRNFADKIEISVNEEAIAKLNPGSVSSVSPNDLEVKPTAPPDTEMIKSYIAIDENYLYVWIGNKWKRTILSDW